MNDHDKRPPTLLALPSYLAGHVARIGHRVLVEALSEHGLRLPHFAALTALCDFGALAQHDLADRLGLNRSHLVGYLDEIERRGLVQRDRDPGDRRRQQVALTSSGLTLTWELQKVAQRSQDEFLNSLTPDERQTLIALLHRVLSADDRAQETPVAQTPPRRSPQGRGQ